ncbi:gamma-glutamyltransferase [Streptomyces griseocarneus]|uniref:gamma-glutamyltransferase n=1 Tax=Streptomyces griseocarneus TaxID=51201 RepID=UPI00167CD05B|nr:gamma-glutamyltransferase [Streptomyces griseocarneus]MBZ6476331.1 gamma-glutamyltransferase [Streptomyces griseocarneus]GHG78143.1 gamma-glutamyltranspeptidase [Streptomyces griseocarneus]
MVLGSRPAVVRGLVALGAVALLATGAAPVHPAANRPGSAAPAKNAVATGYGGAVASVDADATAAGIEILRRGGNAVDAAVATAAALGVSEPYAAGIGGGGYFLHYSAKSHEVHAIDGRETAPRSADRRLFLEHGKPISFADAITSGLAVGAPGTLATWDRALRDWGSRSMGQVLEPAERLARRGFVVDDTFRRMTAVNAKRFSSFPDTARLFLPGGRPPAVGTVLKNPDLAATYAEVGRKGVGAFYRGAIGRDLVRAVRKPPARPADRRLVRPGRLTTADLAKYRALRQKPTHVRYRGRDVYGVAPAAAGGTTVGEALNILRHTDLSSLSEDRYLHRFIEAGRLAFADRGRWVGDPAFERVPTAGLLSPRYADSRACLIKDGRALTSPLAPGDPRHPKPCDGTRAPARAAARAAHEGRNTTHLTVADRWGDIVSYTFSIEQAGGSGITVPGRGFLLNNQLTDFSFAPANPAVHDPNLPGPGKRPRSSMAPTIVLKNGRPDFAIGSPGGATIITTVLQVLIGHVDRGLPLAKAIAAPRASQRNEVATELEPALYDSPLRARLERIGHRFVVNPANYFTLNPEIGAATGVQRLPDGRWLAAAEPVRLGGGSAMVVRPSPAH